MGGRVKVVHRQVDTPHLSLGSLDSFVSCGFRGPINFPICALYLIISLQRGAGAFEDLKINGYGKA